MLTLSEQPLYGTERLGLYRPNRAVAGRETVSQYGEVVFVRKDLTVNQYVGHSYVYAPSGSVTLGDGFEAAPPAGQDFYVQPGAENDLPRYYARETGGKSYELKDYTGKIRVNKL